VHEAINYQIEGGEAQCNEPSAYFLKNYLHPPYYGYKPNGNCVDYSATLTTILKSKGIAARQEAVCLTHNFDAWNCKAYTITGTPKRIKIPLGLGYINGLRENQEGSQPLGHAITAAYIDGQWLRIDATMDHSHQLSLPRIQRSTKHRRKFK